VAWSDRYREQAETYRAVALMYPEGSRRRQMLDCAEVYEELVEEAEGRGLEPQPGEDRRG
jgi:hypothetical protein